VIRRFVVTFFQTQFLLSIGQALHLGALCRPCLHAICLAVCCAVTCSFDNILAAIRNALLKDMPPESTCCSFRICPYDARCCRFMLPALYFRTRDGFPSRASSYLPLVHSFKAVWAPLIIYGIIATRTGSYSGALASSLHSFVIFASLSFSLSLYFCHLLLSFFTLSNSFYLTNRQSDLSSK
jgi:hypothetical protein